MNERIKELAEQAGYKPLSPSTFADELNEIFMQKFAELIVRKCAGLFEIEWGDEKLTGNDVGYVVKKHFGVEECGV